MANELRRRRSTAMWTVSWIVLLGACAAPPAEVAVEEEPTDASPVFRAVPEPLFDDPGAQPNAWADFDNDGDLDLFVGFRGRPNRLYRNDGGTFEDVAAAVGLDDAEDTRVAAWGDFDADGHLDLYIGLTLREGVGNRLYRNTGDGQRFVDVGAEYGVDLVGNTRQSSWIDYDADGDVDLFVAFREQPNRLFRNDGERFVDVSEAVGLDDPRKTVGVSWFDADEDGDLDVFVTNQNGDADGMFINEGGRFEDRAAELGMDGGPRTEEYGGVGPAVTDYDNDGDLDLFVAMYGPDYLYRHDDEHAYTEIGRGTVVGEDYHSTSAAWGDYDNDGLADLFVVSYLRDEPEVPDHLFRNVGGAFQDETPAVILERGASHGVQWVDFDDDGDLDLALANNNPASRHPLYENLLPEGDAKRSLRVRVVDAHGRHTLPGAEVRIYEAGTGNVLGARLVDTGGGYCSQSVAPVHFGVPPGVNVVDVTLTTLTGADRRVTRLEHVAFFNDEEARMEMWLRSRKAARVHLRHIDLELELAAGEGIHTEYSHKFERDTLAERLGAADLALEEWYEDSRAYFCVALVRAA